MKKFACIIAGLLLLCGAACSPAGDGPGQSGTEEPTEVEISLWTYPVGGWDKSSTIAPFLTAFRQIHPEIRVTVKCVDYSTGDGEIESAIEEGTAPDLVLEGPERLVATWGARGLMADLNDLWKEDAASSIRRNVAEACHDGKGDYFIYPLCMTTHCMAINRDLFEEAGALKYLDETTHTWTTENFVKAVGAIRSYYEEQGLDKDVAVVYCGGQGGDQGTRALVTNLCGGSFTDPQHTVYTVDSPENIAALRLLKETEGIRFDPTFVGSDEIIAFCDKEMAMAFCWNVAAEVTQTVTNPNIDFDILPMAFPTGEGEPSLQGGIWGFGIFDNGDDDRIAAAKEFIRFINGDSYSAAVTLSSYLPVRTMERDPYENDELMTEYASFSRYLGDYYQITPHWAEARSAWWKLLQRVGAGDDIAGAIKGFPRLSEE